MRRFTYDLKKIVERGLPGFAMELTKDPRSLRLIGPAGAAVGKRTYLAVRPAPALR